MPVDTAAGLTDALRRCRLLEPAQLEELDRLQASFPAPRALAGELIRRGWLSPYQVNKLLQDRGRDLLLGSYVLLERLGEGGMGEVFKARNWKLGQIVALKLIRKERLDKPDAARRFHREIRAAAQLDHPNIVRAYDADEVGGAHLLVMEYVQGTDLSKLVKKDGPLAVERACDYCRQAALGLQHACERGLVHRDIKPHNLLLTAGGVVKILDMGLARLDRRNDDDASSTMTREGAVMGTLDYIAPEQAMDSHDVDIRADLYSLGCTLYFLLTGKPPFAGGEALQKLLKHRLDEPVPVGQVRTEVPPEVASVVRKLMAKRPEDRYQTPAEAAAALAFAADQEGRTGEEAASVSATQVVAGAIGATADAPAGWSSVVAARSTDQPAAAPRSRRRTAPGRPWVWLGAAIGVVVLGLGLTGLFRFLPRGSNPSSPDAPPPTPGARPVAPLPAPAEITNTLGMKLKLIQPGKFLMGSPKDEEGRKDDEGPQHEVEITRAFYMGSCPVTRGQFAAFVQDSNYQTDAEKDGKGGVSLNLATAGFEQKPEYTWRHPGFSQGDDHPVVEISWNDATAFCVWLSRKEGKTYELPTEAEWEYACRAGTKMRFWCGDADASLQGNANIADASLKAKSPGVNWAVAWNDGYAFTAPVGAFKANPWGLYDMGGNVWQWCADGYDKYQEGPIKDPKGEESSRNRVWRGGSWDNVPRDCRSAFRLGLGPASRNDNTGFRVVLRPATPAPAAAAEPEKEIANSIGMKLELIQPGTFTMGSPKDEEGRQDNEGPQHEVEITKAFYMGACPVTRGQFTAFVQDSGYQTDAEKDGKGGIGLNLATAAWEQKPEYTWRHPGFSRGDDHPVVAVSWNDATAFCAWLSKKEGKTYELPTEAEWEYACRAGTKTRFWCGDADANLRGNANIADASLREKCPGVNWAVAWDDGYAFTSRVGSFKPNPWGLYDMTGNVWQWCADGYDKFQEGSIKDPNGKEGANNRVLRGGSWGGGPHFCRSACRNALGPANRGDCSGFRVVLRPAAPEAKRDEPVDAAASDFDKWLQQVATLSPWKQTGWVAAKLKERNPGFDGTVTPTIENGVVTGLEFLTDKVTDISPLRGLPGLKSLKCRGSGPYMGCLSDLAPLKGVLLASLECYDTKVSDLAPLKGMPLTRLNCNHTRVEDLAPLKGMQLTYLSCEGDPVSDLAPLKGMPLTGLFIHATRVSDLAPLHGMPLTNLYCNHTPVADLTPLRGTPLRQITCDFDPKRDAEILRSIPTLERINNQPVADVWKALDDAPPKP